MIGDGTLQASKLSNRTWRIRTCDIDSYLSMGYIFGRLDVNVGRDYSAGFAKYTNLYNPATNETVRCHSESEIAKYSELGFIKNCGKSFIQNKTLKKFSNINKDEFINNLNLRGKCYCIKLYNLSRSTFDRLLDYFNITK